LQRTACRARLHAKVLVRDEEAAVGSANFDVTSASWESEALLVVDEPAAVARSHGAGSSSLMLSCRVTVDGAMETR
jgi:phosphatidylserine/phosphatidylglycerophosphate/cardiolipin synthase-like enzyme